MSSVLITGSTRGLGLELVNQFLQLPRSDIATIFVTGRSSDAPEHVEKIVAASDGRAYYVPLDVNADASVASAVHEVQQRLNGNGLDVLINNAGIQTVEGSPSQVKTENMLKLFSTNVTSVQRVTSAFLPLLESGKEKKIMNMTSTLGSIGLARNFAMVPTPSYKVSKAALNMLTSLWALELEPRGFTVFSISPGNLKTDLGGHSADLEVSQGASQVIKILLEASSDKDSGAFRDIYIEGHPTYPGTNPPW